jgi:hypothetical protein
MAQSVTINFLNQIDNGNKRYIEYDGQHMQIRPYPRVDAWDSRILSQADGEDNIQSRSCSISAKVSLVITTSHRH